MNRPEKNVSKKWLAAVLGVLTAGALLVPRESQAAENDGGGEWPLGCRLASYGKFQNGAWSHLSKIGIHYVFISVPRPDEVPAVQKQLEAHHLKPLVMRGQTDLGRAGCLDELAEQLATCERMGARFMFLSPKHAGVDKQTACDRLRQAGEIARKHGVVIALETHPDLGTNADVHLETMRRINHPNVRVNFDTGNITYYNENADVAAELRKIVDYVATVEFKDHGGRPKTWDFPALGHGKIDFPGVIEVLRARRYQGPITIEVEGVEGKPWNESQTRQAVAGSVDYLRKLARFK